jgi:uncharacterized protein YccT (UPF0319 family)
MLKKLISIKPIMVATTAAITMLLATGCNQATPIAKVQKSFKTAYHINDLKEAVAKAAKDNQWEVIQTHTQTIELKKEFVKHKRKAGSVNRWKRVEEKYDVNAVVALNGHQLTITATQESIRKMEKRDQTHLFNDHLAKLEKAIYTNLIEHSL